jgi:hypothetical protein
MEQTKKNFLLILVSTSFVFLTKSAKNSELCKNPSKKQHYRSKLFSMPMPFHNFVFKCELPGPVPHLKNCKQNLSLTWLIKTPNSLKNSHQKFSLF